MTLEEDMVDFANAIEAASVNLKHRIAQRHDVDVKEEPKAEKPTLDEINSLKTQDKTSEKGPYQTINKTDNQNNLAFLKLQKYLVDHNGFVILHGFKLWQFSDNQDIIGKRRK